MKYEVIKACVIKSQPQKVGTVVDLDDQLANQLMAIGRIAPYDETVVEDRSIGLDEETKPKRRAKAKKVEEAEEAGED